MTNLTASERKTLNRMAKDIYGCDFDNLDFEEQDQLYCMMEEA